MCHVGYLNHLCDLGTRAQNRSTAMMHQQYSAAFCLFLSSIGGKSVARETCMQPYGCNRKPSCCNCSGWPESGRLAAVATCQHASLASCQPGWRPQNKPKGLTRWSAKTCELCCNQTVIDTYLGAVVRTARAVVIHHGCITMHGICHTCMCVMRAVAAKA